MTTLTTPPVSMPEEPPEHPSAQGQIIGSGLLLRQIRESIGTGNDPKAAMKQAITLLAHELLQASANQTAVRQIASDLQQHAEEIAEFCTGSHSQK